MEKDKLFVLPNGATLKYSPPGQKISPDDWYRTQLLPDVIKTSRNKKKERLYLLNLWSSGTRYHILAADFDNLPPTYISWDSFFKYLSVIFSDSQAIKARSASDKVKLFFLIKLQKGTSLNQNIAIETFRKLFAFDIDLFESLDLCLSGMKITYLNENVLVSLIDGLFQLKASNAVLTEDLGDCDALASTTSKPKAKPYRSYEGDPKALIPMSRIFKKGTPINILKMLLSSYELLRPEGFCISTIKLGRDFDVTQKCASKYLLKIVKLGLLVELDHGFYQPGVRPKCYQAAGELAIALHQLYPNPTYKKIIIPKSIADGDWHGALGRQIGHMFHQGYSLEQVLDVIKVIPGSSLNDRMNIVRRWYQHYVNKSKHQKNQAD